MKTPLKVGLIQGRHPLPVDYYLLGEDTPFGVVHSVAYNAARRFLTDHPTERRVDLYITGLTPALLGALAGFQGYIDVSIYEYDRDTGKYFSRIEFLKLQLVQGSYFGLTLSA